MSHSSRTPATIGALLQGLAEASPDAAAVTCDGRTASRRDLLESAGRLSAAYAAAGVRPGDIVAITLPNSIEFVEATLATWNLGAVPLPLSYRFPDDERQAVIELADARLIVDSPADPDTRHRRCLPTGQPPPSAGSFMGEEGDGSAPWLVTTSGGSTGKPKLIVSAFTNRVAATVLPETAKATGMTLDGAVLISTPMYHGAGFQFAWAGILSGAHVVLLPKFDPALTLELIDQHGVHWAFMVPTMLSRLLHLLDAEPNRHDLSSLTKLWHGAGPCPPWVKEAWIELIGADVLMEIYGASEGTVLAGISGTEWLTHRGSVGRPVGGEVKILHSNGMELPTGEVGEIFMRPDKNAPGTPKVVGAEIRSHDGWTTVGDLGWVDEDGYLYISDRRVDLIVSGGANVFPAEVEAALMRHPKVISAVVVGIPDDDLGQRVHAVVEASAETRPHELHAFLTDRLVRYKIPRSLRIVTESLRDDAGKARRAAIRDQEIDRFARNSKNA